MSRTTACSIALLLLITGMCRAASFDLTSSVQGPYGVSERPIDLGQAFTSIDSARVRFEGEYTPGVLQTRNWIPPRTYPAESWYILVRFDDPGTSWIDKSVHAKVQMDVIGGHVSFELPLYDSQPPSLFPGGNSPPNYDFLLDGQFGLSVTDILITFPEEQLIERPALKITQFSLDIDGVAVPEPRPFALCVLIAVLVCNSRWVRVAFVDELLPVKERPPGARRTT